MKTEKFQVTGMTCASCQAHVTKGVQKVSGVQEVNVSLLANQMTVTYAWTWRYCTCRKVFTSSLF